MKNLLTKKELNYLADIKIAKGEEKRWVYGIKTKKWYLVGPEDRDYKRGITQEEFEKLGEEKAKQKYLSPHFSKRIAGLHKVQTEDEIPDHSVGEKTRIKCLECGNKLNKADYGGWLDTYVCENCGAFFIKS